MINSKEFLIEKFKDKSDLDKIIEIWLECSGRAHHFIDYSFWLNTENAMREIYIPLAETWIYRGESYKIEGFMSLVGNDLASIFVNPAFQNQGIGKLLITKAKSLRDELNLKVYSQNINALKFYNRHNFIIRESRIDPDTNEEEYVMTWRKSKPL